MQNSNMIKELSKAIEELYGVETNGVIEILFEEGVISKTSIRNYLIRKYFDDCLKENNAELIKYIFLDISENYDISVRQAQRVVYDYMKTK